MLNLKVTSATLAVLYAFTSCSDRLPDKKKSRDNPVVALFDGKSLEGWKRLKFNGEGGEVRFEGGKIIFNRGNPFTGLVIDDPNFKPPAEEYEITVIARKTDGRDFFCALTFPVPEKHSYCTFVAGGWGGEVTGLSNIDHLDANRNTTRSSIRYETDQWYKLKVEVRLGRIRCWVDKRLVVNSLIGGKTISVRPGPIEQCQPFGLASFETSAEFKSVSLRKLRPEH